MNSVLAATRGIDYETTSIVVKKRPTVRRKSVALAVCPRCVTDNHVIQIVRTYEIGDCRRGVVLSKVHGGIHRKETRVQLQALDIEQFEPEQLDSSTLMTEGRVVEVTWTRTVKIDCFHHLVPNQRGGRARNRANGGRPAGH